MNKVIMFIQIGTNSIEVELDPDNSMKVAEKVFNFLKVQPLLEGKVRFNCDRCDYEYGTAVFNEVTANAALDALADIIGGMNEINKEKNANLVHETKHKTEQIVISYKKGRLH